MKTHTLFVGYLGCALVFGIVAVSTNASPIVTGDVVFEGQLTAPQNLHPGQTQGPNVKVYLENADLTLSSGLTVNAMPPTYGSGTGGVIPSGTAITDYLLHYDAKGTGDNNNASGSITFDSQIIGLIITTTALNNSDGLLGVSGVNYYEGTDRGLDDNAVNDGQGADEFTISGDTLTIQGWTTIDYEDEVRVILAAPVPDGGSSAVLLGLSAGLLGMWGWRRKTLA